MVGNARADYQNQPEPKNPGAVGRRQQDNERASGKEGCIDVVVSGNVSDKVHETMPEKIAAGDRELLL